MSFIFPSNLLKLISRKYIKYISLLCYHRASKGPSYKALCMHCALASAHDRPRCIMLQIGSHLCIFVFNAVIPTQIHLVWICLFSTLFCAFHPVPSNLSSTKNTNLTTEIIHLKLLHKFKKLSTNICTNLHFVALLPCRSQQFEHQAVNY